MTQILGHFCPFRSTKAQSRQILRSEHNCFRKWLPLLCRFNWPIKQCMLGAISGDTSLFGLPATFEVGSEFISSRNQNALVKRSNPEAPIIAPTLWQRIRFSCVDQDNKANSRTVAAEKRRKFLIVAYIESHPEAWRSIVHIAQQQYTEIVLRQKVKTEFRSEQRAQ